MQTAWPGKEIRSQRNLSPNKLLRRGASVVEMAIVAPLVFAMTIGVIMGGLGVFRYNQVASLAREGARWASVRGPEYQRLNQAPRPTADDLMAEVISKRSVALNQKLLQCDLVWGPNDSTVSVTVRYQWIPEAFFEGGIFQSTAVMFASN